jgi:S-adenosylmethionine:tRNA ribosyltransferase-isomerase
VRRGHREVHTQVITSRAERGRTASRNRHAGSVSRLCHDTVCASRTLISICLHSSSPSTRGLAASRGGSWQESRVADLAQWLRKGDLLVANDSKVFPARLLGKRAGGGRAECLLLEPIELVAELRPSTHYFAEEQFSYELNWWALVNPGQKLQQGARIDFTDTDRAPGIALTGEVLEVDATGRRRVRLTAVGAPVSEAIDRLGHIPLPPYIRRPDTDDDRARYQTMFAKWRGSIAAPTAGLHFDDALMAALAAAGIGAASVTLHVGYGTFKPVTAEDTRDHSVDPERWEVTGATAEAIDRARANGGRIVAVGTTTTRALESAARATGRVDTGAGSTDLCITPGFRFQAVDALLTNFHLPKSSLLMLVAAFGGRDLILAAYRDAIAREFAFYSYGDAMLILRPSGIGYDRQSSPV